MKRIPLWLDALPREQQQLEMIVVQWIFLFSDFKGEKNPKSRRKDSLFSYLLIDVDILMMWEKRSLDFFIISPVSWYNLIYSLRLKGHIAQSSAFCHLQWKASMVNWKVYNIRINIGNGITQQINGVQHSIKNTERESQNGILL